MSLSALPGKQHYEEPDTDEAAEIVECLLKWLLKDQKSVLWVYTRMDKESQPWWTI